MAIFSKKNNKSTRDLAKEVGVAGEVIFESFEKEEARSDKITIKQYREMLDKDPTVESLFNIFTLPIVAATYRIDADENDTKEEQADFIRKNLLQPPHKGGMESPFTLFTDQLLQAVIDGFQLWEKVYRLEGGKYTLKKLAHRDSVGITLIRDDDGGYNGARQQVSYGSEQVDVILPAYKTFLFTHNKARNYLYGRSALTSLRDPYLKKRKLEYLDSIALQADAIKPKVLIRTQEGAVDDDTNTKTSGLKNKVLQALAMLGERKAVASLPYGYDVKEMTQNGRDPHQSIERQNSEMARAFMATFSLMSSQGSSDVGSYALSDNLKDMLMISLKAFMTKMEEHINQYVIADLHDLNFATPHYSEFHYDDITSDTVQVVADAFMKLLEKDRISDEMVQGIEEQTASRLEINLEQLKKDRAARAAEEAKSTGNPGKTPESANPGNTELSDVAIRDFPGLHEELGVDGENLGCIMLDLQTFDVLKHVPNGQADLYVTDEAHSGGAVAEHEAHVTLLYGLLQNGNTIKEQVDRVLTGWKCESVVLDIIDHFPAAPDSESVPIVAKLWTAELQEANKRLSLLPHVNTFTEYNPHVTLAYVKNDPEIIQKWTKALNEALGGMRIAATGINYGDLPEEEEDTAGDGGKFLTEGNQWWRPLTPAEETVKFAEINARMDTMEEQFMAAAEPLLTDFVQKVVDDGVSTKKVQDVNVEMPKAYVSLLTGTIKTAYNYAKTGAADEHGVPAPATKSEAIAGMKDMTDLVISMQQDDIRRIIAEERLKQSATLADDTQENKILQAALMAAFAAWVASILRPTASSIIGRSINNGRNDVFVEIESHEDLYEYSALLDQHVCATCRTLDGSVVTPDEYRNTRWLPPIHFNCRCLWILIRKVSPDYEMPEVTGIDEDAVEHIEHVRVTKKQDLINDGLLQPDSTKKNLMNQLSGKDYTGVSLAEVENSIRRNAVETVAVIDKKTGKVIASNLGTKNQAQLPREVVQQIRGTDAIVTHNHPSGSSFSIQDLKTASSLNIGEIRAVGADYSYSMVRPAAGWPTAQQLDAARRKYEKIVHDKYTNLLKAGKITRKDFALGASHEINTGIARDLGIIYKKVRAT